MTFRFLHFYELLIRYRVVDMAEGGEVPFPLTQEELADAAGLTPGARQSNPWAIA